MTPTQQPKLPILVVGAGPTGLTLAMELHVGGAEVILLDRRPNRGVDGSRAAGMAPRTIEMLDQRGIAGRFLEKGMSLGFGNFAAIPLDFSQLPTRYPFSLGILQAETEVQLEARLTELGVPVHWSCEVVELRQDDGGVELTYIGPDGSQTISGSYVAGCDGGRSTIRKLAHIDFPGIPATTSCIIADAALADPPAAPIFLQRFDGGVFTCIQLRPGWHRVLAAQAPGTKMKTGAVTLDELRAEMVRIVGTDYGLQDATWLSRFGNAARQAAQYRKGRVFLAGDSAHIHTPAGGQGMNTSMQDAFNLGWKLAAVWRGDAEDGLLDTYHDERHPVGERVLRNTKAQEALLNIGEPTTELREIFTVLTRFPEANKYLGEMISGLDVHYETDGQHPLVGHRVPDIDITSPDAVRIFELLSDALGVLVNFNQNVQLAKQVEGWAGRVRYVAATCPEQPWAIPGLGEIPAPSSLLIRPDGYVAWANSESSDLTGLRDALARWFGLGLTVTV